ncbi:MAG: hypothetical protein ACLR9T_01990 [Thomasclavelia sp.]|uniref:hypothetical protein n=1 Tax=Thomasclavelia sp. TaxID=3025757 RepID=UPI0039A3AABB
MKLILFLLFKENNNNAIFQIIIYFENSKLYLIVYLLLPADPNDYENVIIGFIYASNNIDKKDSKIVEVNESVIKVTKKFLNKDDLSLDEFVKYIKDVHIINYHILLNDIIFTFDILNITFFLYNTYLL